MTPLPENDLGAGLLEAAGARSRLGLSWTSWVWGLFRGRRA